MGNSHDLELIERCKRGDRRALEQLLGDYERPVYNAAYRIVGNPDDAADVTQVVFLKAFEQLDKYKPEFKFFSWIYRIAINESINQIKRNRNHVPLNEREISDTRRPDEFVGAGDVTRSIQESLMSLREDYRTVVVLRHFTECSYRQISEILHIPEKTVKSRLYSARQLMKENLKGSGVF